MKKQEKSPWKILAPVLVLGGLGALAGYSGAILAKSVLPLHEIAPKGAGETIGFLVLGFFAVWLTIAIHELGHLGAGMAQGFRIALYTAGFLGIRGTAAGVRFFINRQVSLMGGLAATFPERLESGAALRRKFIRIVAAGPLASLILSALALLLSNFILQNLGEGPTLATRAALVLLLVAGTMSGFIFLATMIPSRSGGFTSDGARLISLLSGGEKGRYEEASLAITASIGAGNLPGEYPPELLERLLTRTPDSLLGLNGHFVAFSHFLDRGELEQARPLAQLIQDNISIVPVAFQGYYLKDVVFFHAFLEEDAEAAHAGWTNIRKPSERDPDAATYRVKAALALLDGQHEAVAGLVGKGMAKIADLPFEGQRRFEEKWLQMLLAAHTKPF